MRPAKVKGAAARRATRKSAVQAATRGGDRQLWILGVCLAATVVALYSRVAAHQFLTFDDGAYVYLNEHVKRGITFDGLRWALADIGNGNWHPLTWLSHMLDVEWSA